MPSYYGIIFAVVALFGWGFGGFYIQRAARAIGTAKALFFIGATGFIFLLPFVWRDLVTLERQNFLFLALLGTVVVVATLFEFQALKEGKIVIIEPLIGIELPITVGLSVAIAGESLSAIQILLIALVFIGIVLAATVHHTHLHYHKRLFEKGVLLAAAGAVGMGLTNFLIGIGSQKVSPLMAVWFSYSLLAVVCTAYLISRGEFRSLVSDLKSYPVPIIGQSVLDNLAWVAFAIATTLVPISIAITIAESYIALSAFLGIFVNHEKLKFHQAFGVIVAVGSVIALSILVV